VKKNPGDTVSSFESARYTLPFVSVIVPVFNEERRIPDCIEALFAQTYPRERYEVLIVDNGSTDATRQIVQAYPVTLLTEERAQSSYAARNRGLRRARGQVLAFTDADCTPVPVWLEEGIRALRSRSADLVGGNVRFVYSPRPDGAEIWDSLTNMQIEQNIRERGVAKTANLFARATVVEDVGLFPEDLRSGGDVIWVASAVRKGFRLVYAPDAEVAHPARRLGPLLIKQIRVGRGQSQIWREDGLPLRKRAARVARLLRPPSPKRIETLMMEKLQSPCVSRLHKVWFASWLAAAATASGSIAGCLHPRQDR
jgi:glycosyltransferase involved in cell wall biosynthesis